MLSPTILGSINWRVIITQPYMARNPNPLFILCVNKLYIAAGMRNAPVPKKGNASKILISRANKNEYLILNKLNPVKTITKMKNRIITCALHNHR